MPIVAELLRRKQFRLKSFGNSMWPVLRSGDIACYRKIQLKDVKTNDIIMVHKRGVLFTHRVIYKKNGSLITKGDNNNFSDGIIRPREVIAKMTSLVRSGEKMQADQLYFVQSSLYMQEIAVIEKEFAKKGINHVFLKGLPIHLHYQKRHPRRFYSDCDILVGRKDFDESAGIISRLGYKKMNTSLSPLLQKLQNKQVADTYMKVMRGFPVFIDLHYEASFLMTQLGRLDGLYPQSSVDDFTRFLLQKKVKVMLNGISFSVLSPSCLVVYLALHFFHHNFRGVYRLELLDRVLRSTVTGKKILEEVAGITRQYKLENFTYPAYLFLKKYYSTPIPEPFLKSIRPTETILKTIRRYVSDTDIFAEEGRGRAGTNRFLALYRLSPMPSIQKMSVFLYPSVLATGGWYMLKKWFSPILPDRRIG